ncbi:CpaD family pilus assembly lipoprotein [Geminicoccaceae bacterium 1502E]|nr:CpaD family pilus assembly lipoprotein [Geminicoccaceae bacterium 1502E]
MPILCRALLRPSEWTLVVLGLTLAACAPVEPPVQHEVPPRPSASLSSAKHEVLFAPGRSELAEAERSVLHRFLATQPPGSGRTVRITGEAGGPRDGATGRAAGELALRRARAVAREVTASLPGPVRVSIETRTDSGGRAALLTMETATADVPGCPQPTAFLASSVGADWRLGCSTASNLAAMAAFPADLVTPAAMGTADGTREAEAVVRHRTDRVKALSQDRLQP